LKPPAVIPFRKIWSVPLNGSPVAPPGFLDARGFFPIGESLVAHDLMDGGLLWSAARTAELQPAVGDGLLFFVERRALVALRQTDGSLAWERAFLEELSAPLVWDNGWLVSATASGAVLAYRASDGEPIWRSEIGARATAAPSLAADRVYVPAENGRILALRVETGAIVWDRRIAGTPHEILALEDRLYVGSTDNYLYCIKTDVGTIDWRWPTGADVVGRPFADARTLYFVSFDNMLRALDRRSGNQRWRRPLPLRPQLGLRTTDGTLIVNGIAPPLRMYSMKDGAPAGEIATDGELASPPYVLPLAEAPTVIVLTWNDQSGALLTSFSRVSEPEPADPKSEPEPAGPKSEPGSADPKPGASPEP
jgi:outer membrane protein assembly factor BamB